MDLEAIKLMWEIDAKLQLGDKITEEEKKFFNDNYYLMCEEMENNYNHWRYHTNEI